MRISYLVINVCTVKTKKENTKLKGQMRLSEKYSLETLMAIDHLILALHFTKRYIWLKTEVQTSLQLKEEVVPKEIVLALPQPLLVN